MFGVRNQDPRLLRFLLPPLIRHYPASLHKAYVGPVNYVFYGIWAVATLILPRRVAGRFMLLRGSDWKAQLRAELGPEVSARCRTTAGGGRVSSLHCGGGATCPSRR